MDIPRPDAVRPTLWRSLRHPRVQLRAFDADHASRTRLPYAAWAGLTGIAVLGSALYGASLSLVFPQWHPAQGAGWIALSAGLAWCLFGPALVWTTRRRLFTCAHACLVTMAYGEAVLVTGAGVNLLLRIMPLANPFLFNVSCIAASNIVMAWALARQMEALGVAPRKTLGLWMVVLNGSGLVLFLLFRQLLGGGH